jgi:hypothetical protein
LLIEKATGFNYAKSYLAPFLSQNPLSSCNASYKKHDWIIRLTICPNIELSLRSIKFSKSLLIDEFFPLSTMGNKLTSGPSGRAAIIFFRSFSEQEHEETYNKLLNGNLFSFS